MRVSVVKTCQRQRTFTADALRPRSFIRWKTFAEIIPFAFFALRVRLFNFPPTLPCNLPSL